MARMYIPKARYTKGRPTHNITIQGKPVNLHVARLVYRCMFCLAHLEINNHGLICPENENHYGYIHRDEAKEMTMEVRLMKLSEMFPSEYLRGIDIHKPMKVQIKSVIQETIRNRDNDRPEPSLVMYFEGIKKGLRLNVTMAKEAVLVTDDWEFDTDNWVGKWVTVYATKVKAFGNEHIVPRIRKPQKGDWQPGLEGVKSSKQAKANGNGFKFPSDKAQEFYELVQQLTGNYYEHPGHLLNVIKGWFNFADDDEWQSRIDIAVSHAAQDDKKETQAIQATLAE